MSVFKHSYSAYTGALTSPRTRILVLTRYGMATAWSSKITVGLLTLCLVPCLVWLVSIYLANNPIARALLFQGSPAIMVDAAYFLKILSVQAWMALVLCAWVAPQLIAFDLADNALPIVLSHPISRLGYVSGKLLALAAYLSLVTWLPCLALFAYQGYASSHGWFPGHLGIAYGLFAGALLWIAFLSLLGLALSAWVKWRVVATGLILGSVFVTAGVGAIASAVLRTRWGALLNVPVMMSSLWARLLGAPEVGMDRHNTPLPIGAILAVLTLACVGFAAMLNARIRARGVVRG